jgi:hypothetical protein
MANETKPTEALPTEIQKRGMCQGCGNDFYNQKANGGKCWSLDAARPVVRYAIHFWSPMDTARNFTEIVTLDCYHQRGSNRTVFCKAIPEHLAEEWAELKAKGER